MDNLGSIIKLDLEDLSCSTLFLVVDVYQDDFILLKHALTKVNKTIPIAWADDGGKAIEAVSRFRTQFQTICLVVDVELPDMNGFELVAILQANDLCGNVIIVFLTAQQNPGLRARAMACGAEAFILKPSCHSDFMDVARELKDICSRVNA